MNLALLPQPAAVSDIAAWLRNGAALLNRAGMVALLYGALLAIIGALMFAGAALADALPMIYALASGFLLVGSIASAGVMRLALALEAGRRLRLTQMLGGVFHAPGLLALLGLSLFLWLIWVTDAGILYGLYFRQRQMPFMPTFGFDAPLPAFLLFSGLMGSVPAMIMLAVATFSVPLVLESRCSLPQAVGLSVRALRVNFVAMLAWASLVTMAVALSLLLLPLFPLVFPLLGFASFACYRQVFPLPSDV